MYCYLSSWIVQMIQILQTVSAIFWVENSDWSIVFLITYVNYCVFFLSSSYSNVRKRTYIFPLQYIVQSLVSRFIVNIESNTRKLASTRVSESILIDRFLANSLRRIRRPVKCERRWSRFDSTPDSSSIFDQFARRFKCHSIVQIFR